MISVVENTIWATVEYKSQKERLTYLIKSEWKAYMTNILKIKLTDRLQTKIKEDYSSICPVTPPRRLLKPSGVGSWYSCLICQLAFRQWQQSKRWTTCEFLVLSLSTILGTRYHGVCSLLQFPMAAMPNCYKCSGLTQQKYLAVLEIRSPKCVSED